MRCRQGAGIPFSPSSYREKVDHRLETQQAMSFMQHRGNPPGGLPPVSASPGRIPITLAFKARHSGSSVSFAGAQSEAQIPCSLGRTPCSCDYPSACGSPTQGVALTILHLHPFYCLTVALLVPFIVALPASPVVFIDSCPINCCTLLCPCVKQGLYSTMLATQVLFR